MGRFDFVDSLFSYLLSEVFFTPSLLYFELSALLLVSPLPLPPLVEFLQGSNLRP